MIEVTSYSVIEYLNDLEVDMVINTINTKGYMGKGLAKEFALWFPEMEEKYENDCKKNAIKPGELWIWKTKFQTIGNIATKDDYKMPSKIEWVSKGLYSLKNYVEKEKIKNVVIPKLGAGLGRISWDKVENEIVKTFHNTNVHLIIALDIEKGPKEKNALKSLEEAIKNCKGAESSIPLFSNCNYSEDVKKILIQLDKNLSRIKRFRDIRNIKGIGDKKYITLLNEFWKKET